MTEHDRQLQLLRSSYDSLRREFTISTLQFSQQLTELNARMKMIERLYTDPHTWTTDNLPVIKGRTIIAQCSKCGIIKSSMGLEMSTTMRLCRHPSPQPPTSKE